MSNEHLCNGGPEDGKQCGCRLTQEKLEAKESRLIDDICTYCHHHLACHPVGPQAPAGGGVQAADEAARTVRAERERAQAGGGQGQGLDAFMVQAYIKNARKSSGYRYSIYICAEECHAAYYTGGSAASIYYIDDGMDLQIRLLFKSERDAEDFQTKLNSFASDHPHFLDKLNLTRRISRVSITAELVRVMRTDYDSGDNADSPEMSLNDVLSDSASVVSLRGDTSLTLQALENTYTVAVLGSKWYKCHLVPACSQDLLKKDPDNFIYASWLFHQHLDGLNTPSGIGLAISLDPDSQPKREEVAVNDVYEERYRVVVNIHFEDIEVAKIFQTILKGGTERIDDTTFKSFIHVRSFENFSKCIVMKLRDQKGKSPWVSSLGLV